jgi:Undecaprenyl-phosphate galactose phosphotransferase WbaP
MPKIGARLQSVRPHLVSDLRNARELESDGDIVRDRLHERRLHVLRLLSDDVALPAERTYPDPLRRWSVAGGFKRVFDIVGAIVLGIVFAPLMSVIVLLLFREGGPVIYRHRRVGRDGRIFECLKFRSMVPDADRVLRGLLELHPELREEWLRDHKLRDDPRITALGRFLRRTSLDELPQIWNVMRGEMSLVGPRPVVREELMRYGRCLPIYLSAKPGITGLWQVTGRNDTDYRRRVALDVYYVRKQNLLLDLYILLKTTRVVLGGGGAY